MLKNKREARLNVTPPKKREAHLNVQFYKSQNVYFSYFMLPLHYNKI